VDEAAKWHGLAAEGALTPSLREQFEAWLDESPEHWRAFAAVEEVEALSGELGADPDYAELLGRPTWRERLVAGLRALHAPRLRPGGRPWLAAAAALVAVAVLTPAIWRLAGSPGAGAATVRLSTPAGEIADFQLADGSLVTLGGRSELAFNAGPDRRRAVLVSGEAFFDVATDASRPFFVQAGDNIVKVTGTQFDVRHRAEGVEVAVLEGSVEVRVASAAGDASSASDGEEKAARVANVVNLEAGEAVVSTDQGLQRETDRQAGAWRSGRLTYQAASLADFASDASRYYRVPIRLESEDVAALKITTSFRADQLDDALDVLDDVLPIAVERAPDHVLLRAAPGG
jgi:transmembrane sensor